MKCLFIGNRRFVLEELLAVCQDVEVGVIAETHLHREPFLDRIDHFIIESREDVLEAINSRTFDCLISNGLPYILPISSLPKKKYINIHPSFLPDLRGVDPVLGSILFERDSGATCHLMDDGIDTGPIISQIRIPYSADLTASILYPLSFEAEKKAFKAAWDRDFLPLSEQPSSDKKCLYFTRTPQTRVIDLGKPVDEILRIIKAFDNQNQGALVRLTDGSTLYELKCHSGWVSNNEFLTEIHGLADNGDVVGVYEDTICIKLGGEFLFLSEINTQELRNYKLRIAASGQ